MQAAEQLWAHHLHLTIVLNQDSRVGWQRLEGLTTLQFGIGALACCPFRQQVIATLHQTCATRSGKPFLELAQLLNQRIQQLIAVVQQQSQPLTLSTQFLGFLAQAFLFQTGEPTQWHGQHRISLPLAQIQLNHQAGSRCRCIAGFLNHGDHFLQ